MPRSSIVKGDILGAAELEIYETQQDGLDFEMNEEN